MSILVDILVSDGKLENRIHNLFNDERFIIKEPNSLKVPSYIIIYLSDGYRENDIKKARTEKASKYIFIVQERPKGIILDLFYNGNTVYVHFLQENPIKEIKERILDDIFLGKHFDRNNPFFKSVFRYSNLAFSVIDRSYRSIYRNNTHKALTHRKNCTGKLCWHAFHYLDDRNKPCEGCPSFKLFNRSKKIMPRNGGFNKKQIPTCEYMIQRLRGKKSVVCIRLEVAPVIDPERKRIVASMEFVSREDIHKEWGKRLLNIETILENSLRGILDEQHFTRARILLYSSDDKSLRGYIENYLKKEGKIKAKFNNIIMPTGQFNREVFKVPYKIRTTKDSNFEERIFSYYFDKKNAPDWLELPLKWRGRILGKLIVDKHGKKEKVSENKNKIASVQQYARFISKILYKDSSIEEVKREKELVGYKAKIIAHIYNCKNKEEVLKSLLDSMTKYFLDCVDYAFFRFCRKSYLLPATIVPDCTSAAIEFDERKKRHIIKKMKSNDENYISAIAYQTKELVAAPFNSKNISQTRCSVPIRLSDHQVVILALRGNEKLLDESILKCIREITIVASDYCQFGVSSKRNQVLVLGNDSGEGLPRMKKICEYLKGKACEPFMVKSFPRISSLSNEENVRRFADMADFIFIEDSFAGGQIAEFLTCVFNRKIIAILYDKSKGSSTRMLEGYTDDYVYARMFGYTTDNLEKTLSEALKWAKKSFRDKVKYYRKIHSHETKKEVNFKKLYK